MLVHPNIDPVAFSIGPLAVRWYGLMYLVGFAAGWWLGLRRIATGLAPVTRQQFDDLLFMAVLGVILGGRLGYVLFYKPGYYLAHRSEERRVGKECESAGCGVMRTKEDAG